MFKAVVGAALAAALAGCGIDPRSDDLRCGPGMGACPQGRDCVEGWCVVDPGEVDAGGDGPMIDGPECPATCSRCTGNTCIIECNDPGECDARVICPEDMDCDVRCELEGSCTSGVLCGGAGRCTISCGGANSCAGDLTCTAACACTTTCSGAGSCAGQSVCPGPGICDQNDLCVDGPSQCNRC